jgi:Transposase IS66 family
MLSELYVQILNLGRLDGRMQGDRRAVDEIDGLDEQTIYPQSVMLGDEQIAVRWVWPASAGLLSTRSGRACMHRLNAVTTPSWAKGLAFHQAQSPLAPAAATKGKSQRRGRKLRRTGHNLLLRLANRKQDVLRFLNDLSVPFTNNQAERDARMMKVKQKISGGFRCIVGATDFATIRPFIATAKKQGWNIIQAIAQEPKVL